MPIFPLHWPSNQSSFTGRENRHNFCRPRDEQEHNNLHVLRMGPR